ncbi:DUF2721 domain-containing protein [Chitinilyticum aquatile]|uniref:DUF2721 domain-containing protein n=1 Tax=Chitinilyticum aquatile TaxID=362520 RepID=UPI00040DCD9B|nr:DUF2721 domain-containing protein [Chitinilyticum aquatile]
MPMDNFSITTPSLLFPAISLLMLAYTNRFLALSSIIRQLYENHRSAPHDKIRKQLVNLRQRVWLIRYMQAFGVSSLLMCLVSMIVTAMNHLITAEWLFVASLILMIISLILCLIEVMVSDKALNVLLSDIELDHTDD